MSNQSDQLRFQIVLEEYKVVRAEALQLNAQIYLAFSASILLGFSAIGWLFGQDKLQLHHLLAPLFSIIILSVGDFIVLQRNRLAHRLALFCKLFIEPKLPDIKWSNTYFLYRKVYKSDSFLENFLSPLVERIAEGMHIVIVLLQHVFILFTVLLCGGLIGHGESIDIITYKAWSLVVILIEIFVIWFVQHPIYRIMVKYKPIEQAFSLIKKALEEN